MITSTAGPGAAVLAVTTRRPHIVCRSPGSTGSWKDFSLGDAVTDGGDGEGDGNAGSVVVDGDEVGGGGGAGGGEGEGGGGEGQAAPRPLAGRLHLLLLTVTEEAGGQVTRWRRGDQVMK